MKTEGKDEEFFDFLMEYAEFFREMEQFEQQKLSIMLGGRLPEIEHVIAISQSNAKRLENLENKRLRLQQEAGLGSLSMGELADQSAGERQSKLRTQLRQLSQSLSNIKFYNSKSMEAAEMNLRRYSRYNGTARESAHPHAMLEGKA